MVESLVNDININQQNSYTRRNSILQQQQNGHSNGRNGHSNDFEKLSHELINNYNLIRDANNGKRIGFYSIGNELGSGNFSQVKLGIHLLTKDRVAVKILDKTKLDEKTQRLLFREITSMEKLHHPNIIRLYEVINTQTRLYICMEFAAAGELYTKINQEGKLQEAECKAFFSQIIAAVDHMHSHNIIHRDIKAENVFFSNSRTIKVGDFGFSTFATREQQLNTFCGSPPYAAPELFRDDSYIGVYVDIWALGVLLYFMITAQMPFKADTVGRLKRCILNGEYVIPSFVSDSCQLLIRGILKQVPADRFTIMEIMESAWLDGESFPTQLEPYQLTPTIDRSELKKEEKLARQYLEKLGINEELLIKNLTENKDDDLNMFENNLIFTPNSSNSNTNSSNNTQTDQISTMNSQEFRNSINGTYRIIYHRIQKQLRNKYQAIDSQYETNLNSFKHKRSLTSNSKSNNKSSNANNHEIANISNENPNLTTTKPVNNNEKRSDHTNKPETKIIVSNYNQSHQKVYHSSTPDIREQDDNSINKTPANPNNLFVKYNHQNSNNDTNLRKRLSANNNQLNINNNVNLVIKPQYPIIKPSRIHNSSREISQKTQKSKTTICSIL